ncbi:MAG: NAD(P)H-hydrate epimerase, partial [Neisseriaceae bacterium]|nr:NAD(P)H-hydrate epimerase [Neisseriaceae bacterium]
DEQGISYLQLMENAGIGAATDLMQRYPKARSILILCGKGNNAGDALVMARVMSDFYEKIDVVFLLGNNFSQLTEINYQKLPNNINVLDELDINSIDSYDLIIDAVFGTGFKGELTEEIQKTFHGINLQENLTKVALDIPSGIHADTGTYSKNSFQAHISYVFDSYKPFHQMSTLKPYYGQLILIDIGIPAR